MHRPQNLMKIAITLLLLVVSAWAIVGQHYVVLTWTETDTTAISYNIYRGTATGVCSGFPTPYASTTAKTYNDTAVTAGTTYFYAVSAVNSAGAESACSAEAQATVPVSPASPSGLQVTAH